MRTCFEKQLFRTTKRLSGNSSSNSIKALCVFAMRSVYHEGGQDIVQDVFFKIWKNRKNININTHFRNFLITSVRLVVPITFEDRISKTSIWEKRGCSPSTHPPKSYTH